MQLQLSELFFFDTNFDVYIDSPEYSRLQFSPLILRRLLNVIYYEHFHRSFLRFQFQSKLLLRYCANSDIVNHSAESVDGPPRST